MPWECDPPRGCNDEDMTKLLDGFPSLKTLVLWQCHEDLFTEDSFSLIASNLPFEELVVCPAYSRDDQGRVELQALKAVRRAAASRKESGLPLKTVYMCLREEETLSHSLMGELKDCVESVKDFWSSKSLQMYVRDVLQGGGS